MIRIIFKRSFYSRVGWLALVLYSLTLIGQADLGAQQVQINVSKPTTRIFDKTIRIRDVAAISGGNLQMRRTIGKLDLDVFGYQKTEVQIPNELIEYRIRLAGFKPSEFNISGEANVVAYSSASPTKPTILEKSPENFQSLIEASLVLKLSEHFELDASLLDVRLISKTESLLQGKGFDAQTLSVSPVLAAELPIGHRSLEVAISDDFGNLLNTNLAVKVGVYRELTMATQNISRGEQITEEKIQRVRRPVDSPRNDFLSFDQVVGHQAAQPIQQYSLVRNFYVRRTSKPAKQTASDVRHVDFQKQTAELAPDSISRNDRVNILVQSGSIFITLKDAKALSSGEAGDYIDFLNPKTNQRVRARLVNANTAVIQR